MSSSNANHIRTRWIIVCVSGEKSLSNRSNMRIYVAGKSGGSVMRAFLRSLSFGNLKRKSSWHLAHWNLECTVSLEINLGAAGPPSYIPSAPLVNASIISSRISSSRIMCLPRRVTSAATYNSRSEDIAAIEIWSNSVRYLSMFCSRRLAMAMRIVPFEGSWIFDRTRVSSVLSIPAAAPHSSSPSTIRETSAKCLEIV